MQRGPDSNKTKAQVMWGLVFFLILCLGVSALGAWVTRPSISTWYVGLSRPWGTPPNWVFGPVWTILYFMMALSAWWVWKELPWKKSRGPLTLFFLQLTLNAIWSWLFFGFQRPDLALVEIVTLWFAIGMTVMSFWNARTLAGALMLPYWAWISFAAYLNFGFWRLN